MDDIIESSTTDSLLEELGGCGRFQVILIVIINLASVPAIFGFLVDSFGMYNPGWRCLDNVTSFNMSDYHDPTTTTFTTSTIPSIVANSTTPKPTESSSEDISVYGVHACDLYESCHKVEFNPDAITYVTEWGLACDRSWILSTMISIRMAGNMLTTFFVGYIGDRYGRRTPMICAAVIQFVVLNLISVFSVSWLMYAVIVFFMGCVGSFGMLKDILGFEYVTPDWRVKISSIPTWSLISILFSVAAMLTRDWQLLRVITLVLSVLVIVPIFWIPKSIRWLSVRGNDKEVLKVVKRIARLNKKKIPDRFYGKGEMFSLGMNSKNEVELGEIGKCGDADDTNEAECRTDDSINPGKEKKNSQLMEDGKEVADLDSKLDNNNKGQTGAFIASKSQGDTTETVGNSYTVISLFRQKGFLIPTFVVGFIAMAIDMLYFAMSFGVISLPGNLYTNMILSSVTELPANVISFFVANLFRRKPSTFSMFLLVSLCLAGIVVIDLTSSGDTKHIGTVTLVMLGKLLLFVGWIIFSTSITELYPTVVRATVKSYMWFASGIGGILAPYLIPTRPETFYICYLAMSILFLICSGMVLLVPETKGKPLLDDFVDDKSKEVHGEPKEKDADNDTGDEMKTIA